MNPSDPFEALVRQHHAAVYRSAFRILQSHGDAEDVTQDVFLRLWRQRRIRHEAPFAARARTLALQLALNRVRGARRRARHEERGAAGETLSTEEDTVSNRELREALHRELASLPEELRCALTLRFTEGLSIERAASLLGCALSTAHARIERGLARLGGRLRELGFAATPALLEESLRSVPDVPVPAGALERILANSTHAIATTAVAGAPFAKLMTFVGIALLAGVLVPRLLDLEGASAPREDPPAVADVPAVAPGDAKQQLPARPQRLPANAAAQGPRRGGPPNPRASDRGPATGTLSGVVVDANGAALPRALVTAYSSAHWGKTPAHARSARTDARGRFALLVPVPEENGYRYHVWARLEGHEPRHLEPRVVKRGEAAEGLRIELPPRRATRPVRFTLAIRVLADAGSPHARVLVRLERRNDGERSWTDWVSEDTKYTNADGIVELAGEKLGRKRLWIDGRRVGSTYESREWSVERGGRHELVIRLELARKLRGRVLSVSKLPLPGYQVDAWQRGMGGQSSSAWTDERGRFEIAGLRAGDVTLSGAQVAPFWEQPEKLPAGELRTSNAEGQLFFAPFTQVFSDWDEPLKLRVKRYDETRSVGLHDAELHGRVLDESDLGVVVDGFDLVARRVPDDVRDVSAWRRDWIAEQIHPRPLQRAIFQPVPPASASFHRCGLAPGRYVLCFGKEGFAPAASEPFWLRPRQLLHGITLRVSRGVTLTGRVVDASDRAVPGAVVLVTGTGAQGRDKARDLLAALRREDSERVTLPAGCVRSGTDGSFEIAHLSRHVPLLVRALHPGRGAARSAQLVLTGPRPPLRLQLR